MTDEEVKLPAGQIEVRLLLDTVILIYAVESPRTAQQALRSPL